MTVSEEDVNRVAALANLDLTSTERTAMVRDLNALLNYFGQLNELDTASISPFSQSAGQSESANNLRADEVIPSLDRKLVLACAPDSDDVFFKVPKVIER